VSGSLDLVYEPAASDISPGWWRLTIINVIGGDISLQVSQSFTDLQPNQNIIPLHDLLRSVPAPVANQIVAVQPPAVVSRIPPDLLEKAQVTAPTSTGANTSASAQPMPSLAQPPNSLPPSNYCSAGSSPEFVFGFAALKSQLGDGMGMPIECEHANPDNGDTLQQTSTGLSFYRKSTNTPTFTNGWDHWGLTTAGLVYWTGSSIDPPGSQ
jgi:hypothetical protein